MGRGSAKPRDTTLNTGWVFVRSFLLGAWSGQVGHQPASLCRQRMGHRVGVLSKTKAAIQSLASRCARRTKYSRSILRPLSNLGRNSEGSGLGSPVIACHCYPPHYSQRPVVGIWA
jgi:hypothetical protein